MLDVLADTDASFLKRIEELRERHVLAGRDVVALVVPGPDFDEIFPKPSEPQVCNRQVVRVDVFDRPVVVVLGAEWRRPHGPAIRTAIGVRRLGQEEGANLGPGGNAEAGGAACHGKAAHFDLFSTSA